MDIPLVASVKLPSYTEYSTKWNNIIAKAKLELAEVMLRAREDELQQIKKKVDEKMTAVLENNQNNEELIKQIFEGIASDSKERMTKRQRFLEEKAKSMNDR
ncbi:unnamed protein product [Didymodactylos carnosus]|uniref:Uncharacterized protein n=1 Tax=Didymodactylos carnosus TaxID=1234261 RepID=A0A814W086_9BILA|nr:unnamed protein product [Didymodactylos carnosus]CAF3959206.1 unnamed protein product [Didymodactylos carnosus]CAF4364839.1 unnamed protein product [Didymodactylos carnosus]